MTSEMNRAVLPVAGFAGSGQKEMVAVMAECVQCLSLNLPRVLRCRKNCPGRSVFSPGIQMLVLSENFRVIKLLSMGLSTFCVDNFLLPALFIY